VTPRQNSRIAGFTFLFYIAVGIAQSVIGRGASAGTAPADRLASISRHAAQVQVNSFLGLVTALTALTLAMALYGLTRDEDIDLAAFALSCRIGEGLLGVVPSIASLALLSLAGSASTGAMETAAMATVLFRVRTLSTLVGSLFFAAGSTVFAYLLLEGRLIPRGLAWLGVVSSLLLVIALPLQLYGMLSDVITQLIWLPMAAFEIPLGVWLLIRGVVEPRRQPAPSRGAR